MGPSAPTVGLQMTRNGEEWLTDRVAVLLLGGMAAGWRREQTGILTVSEGRCTVLHWRRNNRYRLCRNGLGGCPVGHLVAKVATGSSGLH